MLSKNFSIHKLYLDQFCPDEFKNIKITISQYTVFDIIRVSSSREERLL